MGWALQRPTASWAALAAYLVTHWFCFPKKFVKGKGFDLVTTFDAHLKGHLYSHPRHQLISLRVFLDSKPMSLRDKQEQERRGCECIDKLLELRWFRTLTNKRDGVGRTSEPRQRGNRSHAEIWASTDRCVQFTAYQSTIHTHHDP